VSLIKRAFLSYGDIVVVWYILCETTYMPQMPVIYTIFNTEHLSIILLNHSIAKF